MRKAELSLAPKQVVMLHNSDFCYVQLWAQKIAIVLLIMATATGKEEFFAFNHKI